MVQGHSLITGKPNVPTLQLAGVVTFGGEWTSEKGNLPVTAATEAGNQGSFHAVMAFIRMAGGGEGQRCHRPSLWPCFVHNRFSKPHKCQGSHKNDDFCFPPRADFSRLGKPTFATHKSNARTPIIKWVSVPRRSLRRRPTARSAAWIAVTSLSSK